MSAKGFDGSSEESPDPDKPSDPDETNQFYPLGDQLPPHSQRPAKKPTPKKPTPEKADSGSPPDLGNESINSGEIFGGYTLLEPIGDRGGMGTVHRALQHHPRREVAVKRIQSGEDASDEELQRFKIEVESIAKFDHPHIVKVYDCGEHEGELYYSMPLVSGGSLRRKLKQDVPLSPRRAASMIRDVADAVSYAHARGIIHRDIKPANILFDAHDRPLVIDFGCAKRIGADSGLTGTNGFLGTWWYMPPEQATRSEAVDETADVFFARSGPL